MTVGTERVRKAGHKVRKRREDAHKRRLADALAAAQAAMAAAAPAAPPGRPGG